MSTANRELRRRLEREQRAIERRLAEAVAPNPGGPVLGRANIAYELSERTKGTAHGGIGMIARLVGDVGLAAEIDGSLELLCQHRPYHESDLVSWHLSSWYKCGMLWHGENWTSQTGVGVD